MSSPARDERDGRLVEVGDHVWAWVRPDGGWGLSNSGLLTDHGAARDTSAMVVDTQYDLALTAEMLDAMRATTSAADDVDVLVNTHANGDHTFGNQLLPGAEIIASRSCAEQFDDVTPETMAGLLELAPDLGALGEYTLAAFGSFDFTDIVLVPPTRTFDGTLDVEVGDRTVHLVDLGPAHTAGDVVVWLPEDRVVFTGDLLFEHGHPIVWAGPVQGWIEACRRIEALEPEVVVPGHGSLTDLSGVVTQREVLEWVVAEGTPRHDAGLDPLAAARDIDLAPWDGWTHPERLVVNLTALWRDLGSDPADDVMSLFAGMAELAAEWGVRG